jgi:hypothetical protein
MGRHSSPHDACSWWWLLRSRPPQMKPNVDRLAAGSVDSFQCARIGRIPPSKVTICPTCQTTVTIVMHDPYQAPMSISAKNRSRAWERRRLDYWRTSFVQSQSLSVQTYIGCSLESATLPRLWINYRHRARDQGRRLPSRRADKQTCRALNVPEEAPHRLAKRLDK